MHTFSYEEYYLKSLIIPLILMLFGIGLLAVSIWRLRKCIGKISDKSVKFIKRFLYLLLPSYSILFGIILCAISFQSLKYSIHLINESKDDCYTLVGQVEKITPVSNSPRYTGNHGEVVRASIVTVDGVQLYFMSADHLNIGERIKVSYLPHSTMVLSYNISDEPSTAIDEGEVNNGKYYRYDLIFLIIFCVIFVFMLLFGKNTWFDEKKEQRIQRDESDWNENTVRYHITYFKESIIFITVISVIFSGIILWSKQYNALIILLIFSIFGYFNVWSNYKNYCFSYDQNGITIHTAYGKTLYINLSDILSVETTYKNPFLTRGKKVKIVLITYNISSKETTRQSNITLYYTFQIGISRFLTWYDNIKSVGK